MTPAFEEYAKKSKYDLTRDSQYPNKYYWMSTEEAWNAWQAATKVELERCVKIVEYYQVPVGNSVAGELACDWTMDALREIRDEMLGE
jgi:hypothetical protein